LRRTPYSAEELDRVLSQLPGWAFVEGQIAKTYTFPSYAAGVMFAAGVGQLADQMDHHPDLYIGYQKVRVALNTHDADGITEFDTALAAKIEQLA